MTEPEDRLRSLDRRVAQVETAMVALAVVAGLGVVVTILVLREWGAGPGGSVGAALVIALAAVGVSLGVLRRVRHQVRLAALQAQMAVTARSLDALEDAIDESRERRSDDDTR